MATKPRDWPNSAAEARDRAAEEAARGARALAPLLENDLPKLEEVKRIGTALNAFQIILRLLEAMGAKTRP